MVVQMARNVVGGSGYVVGICSGKNIELVKNSWGGRGKRLRSRSAQHFLQVTALTLHKVIDYTKHDSVSVHVKDVFESTPFDAIIDTLGHQALYLGSPVYLVPGGVYSSAGIKPPNFAVANFFTRCPADEAQRVVARQHMAGRRRPSVAGRLHDGAYVGGPAAHREHAGLRRCSGCAR